MRLTHLSLHNFRNYVRLDLSLPPGALVLLGDNAQGKTNLLEAIYYLATSRSPHAGADRELVNWLAVDQEPLPYARLVGHVARAEAQPDGQEAQENQAQDSHQQTIEITLTQQANNGNRYRKEIRLNGVARRAMDLLGQLNVVLFLPEDIALVSGSPSGRRRYLDVMLCQIEPPYCRTLSRYNQIVSRRNALLRDMRERGGDPAQLVFWDEKLVELGSHLVARRQDAIQMLDGLARAIHTELTNGGEQLRLAYMPSIELEGQATAPEVGSAFEQQLRDLRRREIAAGMTLIGPHRDEMRFLINDVDTGVFGSRGQQRTAALAIKLAEVELMRQETGEYPVLLLDDVLSELDEHRQGLLLQRLIHPDGPQQAIVTTTSLGILPPAFVPRFRMWRVELGHLAPLPAEEDGAA
jgi:DNA replication and repair protein RecF